jgi:hypothetical protein
MTWFCGCGPGPGSVSILTGSGTVPRPGGKGAELHLMQHFAPGVRTA